MEKIFENYRFEVEDAGFSGSVMDQIATLQKPSKNLYRTPTLLTAACAAIAIVVLTLTIGLDTMSDKYIEVSQSIRHTSNYTDDTEISLDDYDISTADEIVE